ncbi:O-acyltransferase WSD1 C-terminal [Arabidopsis thaliana x Arabidopsis arenosa]|uniref:O-acyltransferase WSD1 C-terminal n=1 Tax=Arabidopsis thaliana x Arabidopsis arenosa TaxID=1240361 RepID=A0A8T2BHB4_9BRAS|nr:O-acyltransferase WSD1 C-terminal [Arabidopsis thaliana x Arabidopsis arenosa]
MAIERQVLLEGEEPVSPFARLFSLPGLDVFNIVTIGCKTEGNASTIIEGIKNTLINHPRFSSILVTGHGEHKGKARWIPTEVKVEEHVIVPDIDPSIENPDEFLEDYTSNMALSPMDMSKPLWEFHLLKLKTSHAEAVTVARFHHSLGDGMSLMSLLLACTRKTCDPEALPTIVAPKKSKAKNVSFSLVAWLWFIVRHVFHTCVEVIKSMVFVCRARDTSAHIMGKPGATLSANKFIHQIISLDDVKMVKNAMNVTVNDVLFGMVQAGLSRYLNQRFDLETSSKSRKNLHGVVFFNLRPNRNIEDLANMMAKGSKCRWGNSIGYVLIPLEMKSNDDVFEYVRQSKTIMDRKKHSLEPLFSYSLLKLTMEVFGLTALKTLVNRIFGSTIMIFSNVVGPAEEISFFGHQISYIAASTFGIPQALIIGIQSYVDKLIINIGVDVDVIPDPHHVPL